MIRTFLEFLLSRSLDDGTPKTSCLQRLLLRDTRLKRYDHETQQLDTLLRSTAAEQRQAIPSAESAAVPTLPPRQQALKVAAHSKNSRHSFAWLSGLAAAAILLIVLAPNWLRPTAPAVHAGDFSQRLTVVPGEVLRLLTHAAKTSQSQLPQLSPLANLSLPAMPAWQDLAQRVESPVRQELNVWQESWQNFKSRFPDTSQEL